MKSRTLFELKETFWIQTRNIEKLEFLLHLFLAEQNFFPCPPAQPQTQISMLRITFQVPFICMYIYIKRANLYLGRKSIRTSKCQKSVYVSHSVTSVTSNV